MSNIKVLIDDSGSMSVLGKENICQSLVQTLALLEKMEDDFQDVQFEFLNWSPESDNSGSAIDFAIDSNVPSIVITDGLFKDCKKRFQIQGDFRSEFATAGLGKGAFSGRAAGESGKSGEDARGKAPVAVVFVGPDCEVFHGENFFEACDIVNAAYYVKDFFYE